MSDYMLAPGARLEIGSHGTPYETLGSLGACCSGCANGSMGDFSIAGVSIPTPVAIGAAGIAAWWLFFRKKHRKNPARRRYRRSRRSRRSRR